MWKNNAEPGKPLMTIWHMLIASWISKATNKHSEYLTLIAFPLQHWLAKHTSLLYIYIYHLSCLYLLYQHFIYIKCELKISVPDVRLQAVQSLMSGYRLFHPWCQATGCSVPVRLRAVQSLMSSYRLFSPWCQATGCSVPDVRLQAVQSLMSGYRLFSPWCQATGCSVPDLRLQAVQSLISGYRLS